MTDIHDFERVMRRVTVDTMPARDSERRVIIDVKRGRAIDKPGVFDFMREFKYFIVSNHEDLNNEATDVINLTHSLGPGSDHPVNVTVSYRVWCPTGREKQLAETLHHGRNPGEELRGLVSKRLLGQLNSLNGASAFPPGFESLVAGIIRNNAFTETGLVMEVNVALIPFRPSPIKINDSFLVRAKDYYRDENLTIDLYVVSRERFNGIPYPEPALRELIRVAVQNYFAREVALVFLWSSLNTDVFNQRLMQHLNVKLEPGGYEVQSLALERIPQSHDEPYSWLQGIQIHLEECDGPFETNIANVFVSLGLSLRVELSDLEKVKLLLETNQIVPEMIKQATVEVTRQLARETPPAAIFENTSGSGTLNRLGFENSLKARLDATLVSRFHAQPVAFVLRVGESELTKTLAELQKERCEFKVLIARNWRNAEDCLFRGYFKVVGVDPSGWEEFRRTVPGIARIKERLEAAIGTALENDPKALIALKHSLSLHDVESIAIPAARDAVLNDFGLNVSITDIGSDDVESERKIAESVIKHRTESLGKELERYFSVTELVTKRIKELEHEIVMIKATGGRDEAIHENEKRIEELKTYSPTDPIISRLHYEKLRGNHSAEQS